MLLSNIKSIMLLQRYWFTLVYQLLTHSRWFFPASSTTKTGRHDIAEIWLKVALKHQKSKPVYGHLILRHFRLYKVHSYLLTVLNTGFLQSDQVQRSWRPVLVVEEAGKNHRLWVSNW
jgi:Ca2+/H+ antiporter